MNSRDLGDIDLRDYVRIVRKRPPRRHVKAVLAVGVCITCFGAGYVSPRIGKDSLNLSLTEALAMVDRAPSADWEKEQGAVAIGRYIQTSIEKLAEVAASANPHAGKAPDYANIALFYAGQTAIRGLKTLLSKGLRENNNLRYLALLREEWKD